MNAPQRACRCGTAGTEPPLDALLTDQAALALMRADGVTAEDVRSMMRGVAAQVRRRDRPGDLLNGEPLWTPA